LARDGPLATVKGQCNFSLRQTEFKFLLRASGLNVVVHSSFDVFECSHDKNKITAARTLNIDEISDRVVLCSKKIITHTDSVKWEQ